MLNLNRLLMRYLYEKKQYTSIIRNCLFNSETISYTVILTQLLYRRKFILFYIFKEGPHHKRMQEQIIFLMSLKHLYFTNFL